MPNRRAFSLYIIMAVLVICLICLAIIARNWSCREKRHRDPRPPKIDFYGPYKVKSIEAGNRIVADTGRKRNSERIVILQGVEIVPGQWEQTAKEKLAAMAGENITVKVAKRGLVKVTEGKAGIREMTDEEFEQLKEDLGVEVRGPVIGIVVGQSGINLNIAIVEGGYARCNADATNEMNEAEKKAKKQKFGVWSKGKQ